MKKLLVLPLAAFLLAACSETTSPTGEVRDLTPRLGKSDPAPPPPPPTCPGGVCADFDNDADAAGAFSSAGLGIQSSVGIATAPAGQKFGGRYSAAEPVVITTTSNLTPAVNVLFDLYIIGAWEGQPKRGPQHIFEMATRCGNGGAETRVIWATISNKAGGYQSWPENIGEGKSHQGGYASWGGVNELGYAGNTAETNQFQSTHDVASSKYTVSRTVTNSCSIPSEFQVVFRSHNTGSTWNASYGVDNFSMTAAQAPEPPAPCKGKGCK